MRFSALEPRGETGIRERMQTTEHQPELASESEGLETNKTIVIPREPQSDSQG